MKGGDLDPSQAWTTIVGVVRDVPYQSGVWGGTQPMVYEPYLQNRWYRSPYFAVRTSGDPSQIAASDPECASRDRSAAAAA